MPGKYTDIVFDLDGTLIDSSGDITDCISRAFWDVTGGGRQIKIERRWLGLPLTEIVAAADPLIGAETAKNVCARFRQLYDTSNYPLTRVMPGVSEALPSLSRSGSRLFIATNKPVKPTLRVVAMLGISQFFRDVACPDILPGGRMTKSKMLTHLVGKWGLLRDTTLMVGDSEPDVLAAKENGIRCAYYTGGYGERAKAEDLGAEIYFDDMRYLETLS